MYSHGGQGRPQSDWISWQILQERCLRSKLLSPFTKWESNKDTTVALVAALFYLSFPFSLLFYHTHVFASTHLGGDQSWLMSGFFRHCGRRPDSHLKTHSIFESTAAIAFNTLHIDDNIFISFSHFNFLLNCNNLLKMCCCKANQYFIIFFA